jgi:hypothetical protein
MRNIMMTDEMMSLSHSASLLLFNVQFPPTGVHCLSASR